MPKTVVFHNLILIWFGIVLHLYLITIGWGLSSDAYFSYVHAYDPVFFVFPKGEWDFKKQEIEEQSLPKEGLNP